VAAPAFHRGIAARLRGALRAAAPAALRFGLPVALAALVVASSAALLAPASYRVPTGAVDFELQPAWPGGRLILPLGPAGVLSVRAHAMPADVVVAYRVTGDIASFEEAEQLVEEIPALEASVRDAFADFLWSRLWPLLVMGAAAGALVATASAARPSHRRRGWRRPAAGAGAGLAVAAALGLGFAGLALATVDPEPQVEYSGLARNVQRLLPLVRQLRASEEDGLGRLQAHLDGLEIVAAQLAGETARPPRERVTRLLIVSDVHMNAYGASLASSIAAGEGTPVDAVVLAGDMTNFGRRVEARLFVESLDPSGAPVLMVGGNHEDAPAMAAFEDAGYQVLEFAAATVGPVEVYGVSDPVASSPAVESDVVALEEQSRELRRRLEERADAPDVLAVHDGRQAADAVEWAAENDLPLTVVYGNSHVPSISHEGPVVLIDAGTAGASGYEQIGAQRGDWYTFVLLDFPRDGGSGLVAVTTLSYSVDGRSRVEYLPLAQ